MKDKPPKIAKTNAMRLLDKANIPYTAHSYPIADGQNDGISVANKLGQSCASLFKTLVTKGGGGYFVFLIPVDKELDLKAAATAVGAKAVEMIQHTNLLAVTGYVKGGCSPLGQKKPYPTVLDHSCTALATMYFSAGAVGIQIACSPQDLIQLLGAKTALLCK